MFVDSKRKVSINFIFKKEWVSRYINEFFFFFFLGSCLSTLKWYFPCFYFVVSNVSEARLRISFLFFFFFHYKILSAVTVFLLSTYIVYCWTNGFELTNHINIYYTSKKIDLCICTCVYLISVWNIIQVH